MDVSVKNMQDSQAVSCNVVDVIKSADEMIRQQGNFNLIQEKYEKVYNLFFKKIKIVNN